MSAASPTPPLVVRLPARDLTLADVTELAADDDVHRYELDEGTLLVVPPADAEHAALITKLVVWLVGAGYAPATVLSTPGLRLNAESSGRSPDVMLLRTEVAGTAVWLEPTDVALVIEVVSAGSRKLDRLIKPVEYARAGIPHFWRVEREDGPATVHCYALGTDEHGQPAYLSHRAVLLNDLLGGPAPDLP